PYATDTDVAALTARIVILEGMVKDLEESVDGQTTSGGGTVSTLDGLSVETTTLAGMPLTFEGISETTIGKASVKIKVTNNTGKDLENIQLLAIFFPNASLPDMGSGYPKLIGTQPSWELVQSQSGVIAFFTGWGTFGQLNLDNGKSKTFYPELQLLAAEDEGRPDTTYWLTPEVTIEDYDTAD
ncbi:hypothetical protein LCGC14_1519590, partial [marine sediment metagenome]